MLPPGSSSVGHLLIQTRQSGSLLCHECVRGRQKLGYDPLMLFLKDLPLSLQLLNTRLQYVYPAPPRSIFGLSLFRTEDPV